MKPIRNIAQVGEDIEIWFTTLIFPNDVQMSLVEIQQNGTQINSMQQSFKWSSFKDILYIMLKKESSGNLNFIFKLITRVKNEDFYFCSETERNEIINILVTQNLLNPDLFPDNSNLRVYERLYSEQAIIKKY